MSAAATSWADQLSAAVLAGVAIDRAAARRLLGVSDAELPALLRAAFRIRERHHGRRVKLCLLRNARSGGCPEDCQYCSQSAVSSADIPRYRLDSEVMLIEGARHAVAAGARRYCMATSGREPNEEDIARFTGAASRIKHEFPELEICVSLGLLNDEQVDRLKTAGVEWVNHNLNTSERFHSHICTTHGYEDRMRTVETVRRNGLATCCGGIIGMGETDEDLIDLAFTLRSLRVDALPVNFLHPIAGTPLADHHELTPGRCLRALCLFRFTNPAAEIRVAGGRELHLGWFQPVALFVANSIFVDGYLTTPGQPAYDARRMVEDAGFDVETVVSSETGGCRH